MTVKRLFSIVALALAIAGEPLSLLLLPTRSAVAAEKAPSSPPPEPPRQPPPSGSQTRPGGGLDPERKACNRSQQSLFAIVPENNPGYTTSAHPTIVLYVPDRAEDVRKAEFFINTEDEERVGKAVTVQLPATPGIISVSLPPLAENALEEGRYYRWYFALHCARTERTMGPIEVNGWVRKIPRTPQRQLAIANGTPEIWYDAIASLASQLFATPEDATLRERWLQLLQLLGEEQLIQQPILGEVKVE